MRINALLVDDETNNLSVLNILLKQNCPEINIIGEAQNVDDAKTAIQILKPQIIFLDIQMPGGSVFDMLRDLTNISFEVIFVTAYDHYAIKAMKFSAIDYLLKPVNIIELKEAVQRAIERVDLKTNNLALKNLIQTISVEKNNEQHLLALPMMKEIKFVKPKDVVRCESSNNYTTFVLADDSQVLISKPIYEYEEILEPYGFIRCHQSHLINKIHIKSLIKESFGFLLMGDNKEVPIAKGKKEWVKKALGL